MARRENAGIWTYSELSQRRQAGRIGGQNVKLFLRGPLVRVIAANRFLALQATIAAWHNQASTRLNSDGDYANSQMIGLRTAP